ncbi:MAG: hypothetical protein KJ044_10955 [Planctomycetes bacterium]|nr:hypothetical protein [Planctomycetota bacterium]
MPQQAILDLPVVNFEAYLDDAERLHTLCVEQYGLAGFAPHPDAVFHVAASLWRYRREQSLAQVTGLATFFLKALSKAVAARRRLAALRTAQTRGATLREAEEDLDFANRDLDDLTRLCRDFVSELLAFTRQNHQAALKQAESNLHEMGQDGWARELERLARGLLVLDASRIDWTRPLDEVLEALEDLAAGLPAEGTAGSGRKPAPKAPDNNLLERMQAELREYQAIANQASVRLRQIDRERRDLEAMLDQSSRGGLEKTAELERQRQTLELTVSEARKRLESIESQQAAEIARLRDDNRRLRAENERLTNELLQALAQSTEGEDQTEELLARLEEMDSQRLEAAAARLAGVQQESGNHAETAAAARARADELQRTLEELGSELAASEARLTQAQATILALENTAGRSAEFDAVLTESEARLADVEARLIEAEARAEQLANQLEDRDYRIGQLEQRATAAKRNVDTLSGQLAESENLLSEHAGRIRELERENERLRRDLSEAQTRMSDARGDSESARGELNQARADLERLRDELRAERGKSDKIRADTGRVRDELAAATSRAEKAESEARALGAQLEETRAQFEKRRAESEQALAAARAVERRAKEAEQNLARAGTELDSLRARLAAAESAARDAGGATAAALEAARHEAASARSELESLRRNEGASDATVARLRSELAQVKSDLAQAREDAAAARDLLVEKLARAEEKLNLAAERIRNADAERKALAEANEAAENARMAERAELEGVIDRMRREAETAGQSGASASAEVQALKAKLNEADAFVISRERELEKLANRVKYLLGEIGAVADLRARFEQARDDAARDDAASQISRKLDSLFAEAGRKVHADRRTEKIVILHVKKDPEQVAQEAEKPFVATKDNADSKPAKPSPRRKRDAQS